VTYDQVAKRQQKAVQFLRDVVGDDDRADEVENESVEDYADRKGLVIANAAERTQRRETMANGNGMTKDQLQDAIDDAVNILSAAYTVEATRSDLAGAIADALDALAGDGEDDDDDTDDDDSDA